ncbi:hypothetical protein [Allosalinactinospora lopnorensis]|uniref:hypothetical protein n=1 Tax=Allosalinactinospora lopnorensis TaxID=1352348 RepID=UPI000623BCE8|nr:hypothetical protein [Allosalinactinospora lopnorensis]
MSTVYAYPWDVVGDPGAADRLAGLKADTVAVAASYHTVRAATPQHPDHRMVQARSAACYVPVRPSAWQGSRLVPAEPDWVPGPDPFGAARDALHAAGTPVHAWVVLTHNSLLGTANEDLVVRNAFGDRYTYALCPSAPDVVDYCERLVSEVMTVGAPDGLILEACGPLGARHGGHHEKTEGADWTPVQLDLLSLCFCAACLELYRERGVDPVELKGRVRDGVDATEPPESVDTALGPLAEPVRAIRTGVAADLAARLVARARAVRPDIRITMHASADPWATGPFSTAAGGVPEVDCLVGNCWIPPDAATEGLAALRRLAPSRTSIGAYVLALPPQPADPEALGALTDRFASAGADEFHMYHGGLASARRLATVSETLAKRSGPE